VFEQAAACELDAATSVKHAIAAAIVPLPIVPLRIQVFIFFSPRILISGSEDLSRPVRASDCRDSAGLAMEPA
jgi:hypothetical protein